uniref:Sulfite reductase [NADPH] flavoprotein alpha-component n=1 Tax=Talaromyces marneffei PM1 TaxID=1077442 RepID=A0A093V3X3_TALMA
MYTLTLLATICAQALLSHASPFRRDTPSAAFLIFNGATPEQSFSMTAPLNEEFTIDSTITVSSIQGLSSGIECTFFVGTQDVTTTSVVGAEIVDVGPPSVLSGGVCLQSA